MSIFTPRVRIIRKSRPFSVRNADWTKLLLSSASLFDHILGGAGLSELEEARIENLNARTDNLRAQNQLLALRAQELGNKVTLAEQRAEKMELELLKLRHELEARGIVRSDKFTDPTY